MGYFFFQYPWHFNVFEKNNKRSKNPQEWVILMFEKYLLKENKLFIQKAKYFLCQIFLRNLLMKNIYVICKYFFKV